MPSPIEIRGLKKMYKSFAAVKGIDFDLRSGECLGLLGPNGAGKTTTIRMISCFLPLTEGSIRVLGMDTVKHPREVKAKLGICPQEDSLDPDFTVLQNLTVYARYFDLDSKIAQARAAELLEFVELSDKAGHNVNELSGGMKRRLVMARSLIHQPELLILDEPTTGLDPSARQLVWRKIRQLKDRGVSVLLTSHYMEEVSQLCDRVIMMDHGKIVLEGKPAALIQEEIGREVVELWNTDEGAESWIVSQGFRYERFHDRFFLLDPQSGQIAPQVAKQFPQATRLVRPASLEDVFLKKTGQRLES